MTHTASPLPCGKYPPFLPNNFYDAPQHASFGNVTPSTTTPDQLPHETLVWQRTEPSQEPCTTPAVTAKGRKGRGRPANAHSNSLKPYLQGFNAPGFALAKLPLLDDIVTGALKLDLGGNTRPLGKKTIIRLLQRLDVISTKAVQEYMHLTLRECSERHAQKIAQCLRVIEWSAAKVAKTQWPAPTEIDQLYSHAATPVIEPCGNISCTICARTGLETPGWGLLLPESHEDDDDDFAVEVDDWAVDD